MTHAVHAPVYLAALLLAVAVFAALDNLQRGQARRTSWAVLCFALAFLVGSACTPPPPAAPCSRAAFEAAVRDWNARNLAIIATGACRGYTSTTCPALAPGNAAFKALADKWQACPGAP